MRTWTDKQLIEAVKSSRKLIEVAQKLGLTNLGSNYKTIKKYIKLYGLDTTHFLTLSEMLSEARGQIVELTNEELFCVNLVDRKHVKNRILRDSLIEYKCQRCHITHWEGEELSLHLDHINGINNDNRLENLRFLCPNCHSLTDTYCAKNKNKNNHADTKETKTCQDCGVPVGHLSIYCQKCVRNHREQIVWPEDNVLLQMVNDSSYSEIGRQLNVSGNAVKKRLHSKGLLMPRA
jgi:Zn finger protein HypA/HybF involved in hydrogenase expression/ribosomal protein S14